MNTSKHLAVLSFALLWTLQSCSDSSSTQPAAESQQPAPPPAPINPADGSVVGALPREPASEGGSGEPSGSGSPGQPVPEPATMLLIGTGLAGVAIYRRRRKHTTEG